MKTRRVKRLKRTKKGGNWLFPKKCGFSNLNYDKSFSSNMRNCKKNKDIWNKIPLVKRKYEELFDGSIFPGTITCDPHQVEFINFPSNPECVDDIIEYNKPRFK